MRPKHTPARSSRLAGATGALLLQGGLLLLFLASMPAVRPPLLVGKELIFTLPRIFRIPPPATAPQQGRVQTAPQALPLPPQAIAPAPTLAPPPSAATIPGLLDFGQALNGCAPEKYNSLTPEQRAHCPRPGAGVAIQQDPALGPVPGRAKDEALWQEQWDETHWMPGLCVPSPTESVVSCLMHQSIAESERGADVWYHLDRARAAARRPPR